MLATNQSTFRHANENGKPIKINGFVIGYVMIVNNSKIFAKWRMERRLVQLGPKRMQLYKQEAASIFGLTDDLSLTGATFNLKRSDKTEVRDWKANLNLRNGTSFRICSVNGRQGTPVGTRETWSAAFQMAIRGQNFEHYLLDEVAPSIAPRQVNVITAVEPEQCLGHFSVFVKIGRNVIGQNKEMPSVIPIFQVQSNFTVAEFKTLIKNQVGVPSNKQRLNFAGKKLEDDRLLTTYGIGPNSTVNLLTPGLLGGQDQNGQDGVNFDDLVKELLDSMGEAEQNEEDEEMEDLDEVEQNEEGSEMEYLSNDDDDLFMDGEGETASQILEGLGEPDEVLDDDDDDLFMDGEGETASQILEELGDPDEVLDEDLEMDEQDAPPTIGTTNQNWAQLWGELDPNAQPAEPAPYVPYVPYVPQVHGDPTKTWDEQMDEIDALIESVQGPSRAQIQPISGADRVRNFRANQTPDQRQQVQVADQQRKRRVRADQTQEEREQVQIADQQRKRRVRANQTLDERQQENAEATQRMQNLRDNQTPEEREQENAEAAQRMQQFRANQDEDDRQQTRAQDREYRRGIRADLTEEQRQQIRDSDRQYRSQRRANQTPEERELELSQQRERMARLRSQRAAEEVDENENDQQIADNEFQHETGRAKIPLAPIKVYPAANSDKVVQNYLGQMKEVCKNCGAKYFRYEPSGSSPYYKCCAKGTINEDIVRTPGDYTATGTVRPAGTEYPQELRFLFQKPEPPYPDLSSTEFTDLEKNMRAYNSGMSLASFSADTDKFGGRNFPYCFKVHGAIQYFFTPAINNPENRQPRYNQLYFYDGEEATRQRSTALPQLKEPILRRLDGALRQLNPHVTDYLRMKEAADEFQQLRPSQQPIKLIIPTIAQPAAGVNPGQQAAPRVNEIAAIFAADPEGHPAQQELIYYVRDQPGELPRFRTMKTTDRRVDSYIYPLIFPRGEDGWHPEIKKSNGKKLNRGEFIRYLLRQTNFFNPIFGNGRLLQQFVVDQYLRIQDDTLQWVALNQKKIKAEYYKNLHDYLDRKAADQNKQVGIVKILPSSVVGSMRYMNQKYQDAMAIVRSIGKPSLFITFTCNPNWTEIKENLLPGKTANDNPLLVTRVFAEKVDALVKELKKGIFGSYFGHVYSIEFQKRGLPHVHLLLFLDSRCMIDTPDLVDRYISAEIPDKDEDPVLHDIVTSNMLHTKCDANVQLAVCRDPKTGKCKRGFPKKFAEETMIQVDKYPIYRRRETAPTFVKSNKTYTSQDVVPYNAYLLKMFPSHINVEVVSSIRSVQYLFKYIFKGPDTTDLNVEFLNHDEIERHVSLRYVSAMEAAWHINRLTLIDMSHSVKRLPVHLREDRQVRFDVDATEEEIQEAVGKKSQLEVYFEMNANGEIRPQRLYVDMPLHYTWDGKNCKWNRRTYQVKTVARMYNVSPRDVESFHLRVLLLHRADAISYEDLRTDPRDGTVYPTFQAACVAFGYAENDDEWRACLNECASNENAKRLRKLFALIMIHCQPSNPGQLWDEFKGFMISDYKHRSPNMSDVRAETLAYNYIERIMNYENTTLTAFEDMPTYEALVDEAEEEDAAVYQQRFDESSAKFNEAQEAIVKKIVTCINEGNTKRPNLFFIDGPAGTGKTFIIRAICDYVRAKKKKFLATAFTGIAAILLPNGRTNHTTFKLPVPLLPDSNSSIQRDTKDARLLQETDVIMWDEVSMTPKYAAEVADRTLQDLCDSRVPFAGKIVIFSGDFRQCLPVQPGFSPSQLIRLSCRYANFWPHVNKSRLVKNMRALQEERKFAAFVLQVGNGHFNDNDSRRVIPNECVTNQDLAEVIFRPLIAEGHFDDMARCAILAPHHVKVNEANEKILNMLEGEDVVYTSVDSVDDQGQKADAFPLPHEYLNSIEQPGLPPHKLRLRKNAIVMIVRNLSIIGGLCNGTRLLIVDARPHSLRCRILTGDRTGEEIFLPRMKISVEIAHTFTLERIQFPVTLAFAMTINKSQGQTLNHVGVDLRSDVFAHGQLYVAFSRAVSFAGLEVYTGHQIDPIIKVKNIVWEEALERNEE